MVPKEPHLKEMLRMPRAPPIPLQKLTEYQHDGIIVEKSGEDNNESKKNRVMYLYSKTVRKHCGKLVCSVDWRDYKLGEWIRFTQQANETYFGSAPIDPPFETRMSPTNEILVQVKVQFFVVPNYISYRRTHHLEEPLQKLWSPELGGAYVDLRSMNKFKIMDGVLYKGWLQYSLHPVNFNVHDQDPEGWPYEPNVYWQLLHEKGVNDTLEIVDKEQLLDYYLSEFGQMAYEETELEKQSRAEDSQVFKKLSSDKMPVFL